MQFCARPPPFLVLIQRGLFVHDKLTGRNTLSPSGKTPDTTSCRRLFEKRQIIPAPASGLSVLSKTVQPFLSPVVKIAEILSVFCCYNGVLATVVSPIRALNPRNHK